jgi:threonine aldolase
LEAKFLNDSHANTSVSTDRYQEAPTISNMLLSFNKIFQHKNPFFVVTDTNTFKSVSLSTKNRMTGQTKETDLYFMEPMESI